MDNRSHENAEWDDELLRLEFGDLKLARLIQCAPMARITSGGGFHPESCRLLW
jgi:hypothetical protein